MMPSPSSVAAMIAARSDGLVVLRRQTQVSPPLFTDAVIPALVRSLSATGSVADAQQQVRRSVVVASDHLAAAGFPLPVTINDIVVTDPVIAAGAYVAGTGTTLRVIDPGARGGVGFWLVAEGA
ncbi:hypothetical protein MCW82_07075 [Azospirillum doebereinerae]|uniref:hypothetical protein n=1 Tax=Azospirillum doebereinerae TaxID=92933 RepID=UPI001EE5B8E3|nr:hypothetical protein [Azospirillum doebereinerae]MCG5239529.1 hypothetical protein [Azospirillum doebereinerae]